jgi:predicted RNA-binding Zn ribbon-like protein
MTDLEDRFALLRTRPDLSGRGLAPGPLAGVQAFVNTVDLEHGRDVLATPAALGEWLVDAGLLAPGDPPAGEEDLRHAHALREALRALLLANAGDGPPPAEAGTALEAAADRAGLAVRFGDRARLRATTPGTAGALGALVAIAYDAMAAGTWDRLKACPRERCHCAFYDRSRNRSGVWCNMAVCGSREKAAAYHRRVRSAARGPRAA